MPLYKGVEPPEGVAGAKKSVPRKDNAKVALILPDAVSTFAPPLRDAAPGATVVFVEPLDWAGRLPYHKKKLTLVFSAMRHAARELIERGATVFYLAEEESLGAAFEALAPLVGDAPLRVTEPRDRVLRTSLEAAARAAGRSIELIPPSAPLVPIDAFEAWLGEATEPTAQEFGRRFATELGLAGLDVAEPAPIDAAVAAGPVPPLPIFPRDSITRDVVEMVDRRFGGHFGALDGFVLPVTTSQAEELLEHFLRERLPLWPSTREAMRSDEPFLFHSIVNPYLNLGLLSPQVVIERTRELALAGAIPRCAARAFLEQAVAAREFVFALSSVRPEAFGDRATMAKADQPLPAFLWTGETPMRCLSEAVRQVRFHGFHTEPQRSLLIGNFCVVAGVTPAELLDWHLVAYLDAHEWTAKPAAFGTPIATSATGSCPGAPSVAAARDIHRRSDYCEGCGFDPAELVGERACPYNTLYWDFVDRNRPMVEGCKELRHALPTLDGFDAGTKQRIRDGAARLREELAGSAVTTTVSQ